MRNKGFTLIELLVVVAIIGVLAAIGIPRYYSFIAKSRTAEVKVQFSAIHVAMQSFYIEFGRYHTCLKHMGVSTSLNDQTHYAIGFKNTHVSSTIIDGSTGCSINSVDQQHFFPQTKSVANFTNLDPETLPSLSISADGESYTLGAAGYINDLASTPTLDSWSIDNQKNMNYIQIGY